MTSVDPSNRLYCCERTYDGPSVQSRARHLQATATRSAVRNGASLRCAGACATMGCGHI